MIVVVATFERQRQAPAHPGSRATLRNAGVVVRHGLAATNPAAPVLAEPNPPLRVSVGTTADPGSARPSTSRESPPPTNYGPLASGLARASATQTRIPIGRSLPLAGSSLQDFDMSELTTKIDVQQERDDKAVALYW